MVGACCAHVREELFGDRFVGFLVLCEDVECVLFLCLVFYDL